MYAREERNQDATVFVGELDSRVTEALLWELMLQSGPVGTASLPPGGPHHRHFVLH
jgi:splicing factor 3B subunit 4